MNTKISILLLSFILIVVSCNDNKDTSPIFPKFEGVTFLDQAGNPLSAIDTTDWRINDKFTELERNLFDTLKFDKALHLKSSMSSISIRIDEFAKFYPNPVEDHGYFEYRGASIINIVLVDSVFTKKIEFRTTQSGVAVDFTSFSRGVCRMYYVLQDSQYNIIGLGHGDIKVYRN